MAILPPPRQYVQGALAQFAPVNEAVSKLGQVLAQKRERENMAEIGKAAQGGDLAAARDMAGRGGYLQQFMAFDNRIEQDKARAAAASRQQQAFERQQAQDAENKRRFELELGLRRQGLELQRQKMNRGAAPPTSVKEYNIAKQQGFKGSLLDFKKALKKAGATTINNRISTKGMSEVDKLMAKTYNEYVLSGKRGDMMNRVNQLNVAISKLREVPGLTGLAPGAVAALGDEAQNLLTPQTRQVRQEIETTAQRSLKEVLGAQFARVEGEQLLSRAFNPALHPEINARRAERIMMTIKSMLDAKDHASDYFAANSFSMQGYKPPPGLGTQPFLDMLNDWKREDEQHGIPLGRTRIKKEDLSKGATQFDGWTIKERK